MVGPPLGGLGKELLDPHGIVLTVCALFAVFVPLPALAFANARRRKAARP